MKNMKLYSEKQAERWGEAYPIGNGHMGAMVYGTFPENRILFTENTFFSGKKSGENNQDGADLAFSKMRVAAGDGKIEEVHLEAENFIGKKNDYGTNLPVGNLFIEYTGKIENPRIKRILDINSGLIQNVYKFSSHNNNIKIKEECFMSHPDNIFALKIEINRKQTIKVRWEACNKYGNEAYEANTIVFHCKAYERMHCDNLCGVELEGKLNIETDGKQRIEADGIQISGATKVILYVRMKTNFEKLANRRVIQNTKITYNHQWTKEEYEIIKQKHSEEIETKMKKVSLELDMQNKELATKSSFLFQYGRYLLLSSSREDSVLPAHLQGIWNDNVACNIGWTCDMHLDINTQMNYWLAETTNLSETTRPLFNWIESELVPQGRQTAEISYGRKGWVAELVSNAWGFSAPYWNSSLAPCPTGGVWIISQMWEHFQFTNNRIFLKAECYPILAEAVLFFMEYVFADKNGNLTSGPSISPENSFNVNGKTFQISNGCTYEIIMIRELFIMYLKASELLEVPDRDQYEKVRNELPKLLPYRIVKGEIAEYATSFDIPDKQHRHTSHLLGLYPFVQITLEKTPELCVAAENVINRKLTPEEKWEDTGWARNLLTLYEARLQNGEKAYKNLNALINKLLEPNGMIYHPPTRGAGAFDHVYELDGNTGFTAAIVEMLLQSQEGSIHVLPALPKEWKSGKVSGLQARRGITVDIVWKDLKLTKCRLLSQNNQNCTLVYKKIKKEIHLQEGELFYFKF